MSRQGRDAFRDSKHEGMKRRTGVWRGKRIVTGDPSELREDEICLQEAYGEDGSYLGTVMYEIVDGRLVRSFLRLEEDPDNPDEPLGPEEPGGDMEKAVKAMYLKCGQKQSMSGCEVKAACTPLPQLFVVYVTFFASARETDNPAIDIMGYPLSYAGKDTGSAPYGKLASISKEDVGPYLDCASYRHYGIVMMLDRTDNSVKVCPDGLYDLVNIPMKARVKDGLCFSLNPVARRRDRDVEVDDKGQRVYRKVAKWSADYGVLGTIYRKCPLANHSGKVIAKTMRGMRDDFMDGSYPKE